LRLIISHNSIFENQYFNRLFVLAVLLLAAACQSVPVNVSVSQLPTSPVIETLPVETNEKTDTPTSTLIVQATTIPIPPSQTPTFAPPVEALTTTILFTGVIVPARCVQATIDEKHDQDYPYLKVRDLLTSADLSVGVLNATMSDRVEHSGCNWSYQMVGSAANADAAARAGIDLMSVATNHIKDCGTMKSWCNYAFFDTLDNLSLAGVQTVGAGKDLAAALQPAFFTIHGVRFGFVAMGDSKMTEDVFATETNPGIAFLNQENMQKAISLARQNADVIIALPHWGPEASASPNAIQLKQAQQLVKAGANLVVGNHTHVVQAIQQIEGVPVFYGLGNFIFDQWYPEYRQGVILLVKFKGTQYIGYELIPTHTNQDGQVRLADPEEAAEIIQRIEQTSATLR
jgi:poly-gamma-glutamate capsule biosynthesis protein CapA/YwtB (metallophosphatase superfamily)